MDVETDTCLKFRKKGKKKEKKINVNEPTNVENFAFFWISADKSIGTTLFIFHVIPALGIESSHVGKARTT